MRLSMDKSDPGFNPRLARKALPYLDGKYVDYVITADEDQGLLVRYKTQDDSHRGDRLVRTLDGNGIETEVLFGKVSLRFKDTRK